MSDSATLPKIDFTTFVLSVASAAYLGLGMEGEVNLPLAQQNIDLLDLIRDKTRGNLSAEEAKLLDQLLFETRMRFVEVQKK